MMFVVYQKKTSEAYPIMIGVFLMKCDAKDFINSQICPDWFSVEEVEGTWGYWNMIREKLNEQVYRTEEEY
jgi:hypothetical protein